MSINSAQRSSPDFNQHSHRKVVKNFKYFHSSARNIGNTSHDLYKTSATKLQNLLEKRQLSLKTLQNGIESPKNDFDSQETLPMEDLATLLNDSHNLTKHLEEQVQFYQDRVQSLQQRSQKIVVENEMLYEQLKGNLITDVLYGERKDEIKRQEGTVKQESDAHNSQTKEKVKRLETESADDSFHDRQYLFNLEQEMDKIKKLNQQKTHRLESILQSTREELEKYRCDALKLQSRLRAYETESEQRHGAMEGNFSLQPTDASKKTIEKLTRERDELVATLARHKSLLTQLQQREFEAYIEVKKSVETVEEVQLEKAEAIIKIQQLRNSMEEDRTRHECVVASTHEKTKQECAKMKENYEKKIQDLQAKIEEHIHMCVTTDNQLERLSQEKVNLMKELEKTKAELTASRVDMSKVAQDAKEEVVNLTRQHVKTQQEISNLQNLQTRQIREHEQEKTSFVTENEELRQRLCEAQNGWLESREECIRTVDKLKKLENDLHLEKTIKTNLEKARQDSSEFLIQQAEQRERQFLEILDKKESEHAVLQRELEQFLEAQIQISQTVTAESQKLTQKLEDKTLKHRLEKREWRKQHSQLSSEHETLLKKYEVITRKNDKDSKVLQRLSVKVNSLKEEKRKTAKTIYELLKKQNDLLQDRQNLSREVEYFRSEIAIYSPEAHQMSVNEETSRDDTLSDNKPINGKIEDESL